MVNVEMTVREVVDMIGLLGNTLNHPELRERMIKALEVLSGEASTSLTLHSFPSGEKISCIKIIRAEMGWKLKDCKDWVEVVEGELSPVYGTPGEAYSQSDWDWHNNEPHVVVRYDHKNGRPNTLSAPSVTIQKMAHELRAIGCVVTTG